MITLRSRAQRNAGEHWHRAKVVVSESTHIEPHVPMDFEAVKAIADQEAAGRRKALAWRLTERKRGRGVSVAPLKDLCRKSTWLAEANQSRS